MVQKYYNTQEAAKILDVGVDDVKQMLERRELHGYRDGADWKFKVEEIDARAKAGPVAKAGSARGRGRQRRAVERGCLGPIRGGNLGHGDRHEPAGVRHRRERHPVGRQRHPNRNALDGPHAGAEEER